MTHRDAHPLKVERRKTADGTPFLKCLRDDGEVARVYMRRRGVGVNNYELGFVGKESILPHEMPNVLEFARIYWQSLNPVNCSKYERVSWDHSVTEGVRGTTTYPFEYFGPPI